MSVSAARDVASTARRHQRSGTAEAHAASVGQRVGFAQLLALYYSPVVSEDAIALSCYALGATRASLISKLYARIETTNATIGNLSDWDDSNATSNASSSSVFDALATVSFSSFVEYAALSAADRVPESLEQVVALLVALNPFTYRTARTQFQKLPLVERTLYALQVPLSFPVIATYSHSSSTRERESDESSTDEL